MRVLMPLPAHDFDPTESAVPWRVLVDKAHDVVFATPDGAPAQADERMLTGKGLGPWARVLRADDRAVSLYREMANSDPFRRPMAYSDLDGLAFDVLLLPGGHAPRMRAYVESEALRRVVTRAMLEKKTVGAVCHGVLLLARAQLNGASVLEGRKVTALLAKQELLAHNLTRLWLGDYYRTYPETVQTEVTRAVGPAGRFLDGPTPLLRDDPEHLERGYVVVDDNLVTARWPGDAWRFGHELATLMMTRR
jgi:protease I